MGAGIDPLRFIVDGDDVVIDRVLVVVIMSGANSNRGLGLLRDEFARSGADRRVSTHWRQVGTDGAHD